MKSLLLVVALCGTLVCALPIGTEEEHISDHDMAFAKKNMENYDPDYENAPPPRSKIINTHTAAEKMKEIQKLFQLQVTGKVDSTTLDPMKMPRCGFIDVEEFSHYPGSPKWPKEVITYSIQNYTPDMDREDVDETFEKGWKVWSDVTPLTFIRVYDDSADIKIYFVAGYHGHSKPFDGPCIGLAHAFSPGNHGLSGDAHFDDDEFSSKDLKGHGISEGCVMAHASPPYEGSSHEVHFDEDEDWSATRLYMVSTHEFGHLLGLAHSNVREALMFATFDNEKLKNIRLHQDDIDGIQSLYGARLNSPSEKNMLPPPEAVTTV